MPLDITIVIYCSIKKFPPRHHHLYSRGMSPHLLLNLVTLLEVSCHFICKTLTMEVFAQMVALFIIYSATLSILTLHPR